MTLEAMLELELIFELVLAHVQVHAVVMAYLVRVVRLLLHNQLVQIKVALVKKRAVDCVGALDLNMVAARRVLLNLTCGLLCHWLLNMVS